MRFDVNQPSQRLIAIGLVITNHSTYSCDRKTAGHDGDRLVPEIAVF